MSILRFSFTVLFITVFSTGSCFAQKKLGANEAKEHVGETATVCGNVASAHYAASSRRQPTFLNLDRPYPDQIFTIVIWGSDRAKFGNPEHTYPSKRVCVTGQITSYKGVPEVQVSDPSQIEIQK
jgi:hypothetical protein